MADKNTQVIERGNWTGRFDFILSCIGYAVGLGNVWRFPYMTYRNGGATFLIPYVIMLVLGGLPLFFMELALGQFASEGPITVWKVSPLFTGVGIAMVMITSMVSVYYNVIVMWSIYYMFVSFVHLDDKLPWMSCNQTWNTDLCKNTSYPNLAIMNENETMKKIKGELYDFTCVEELAVNISSNFNMTGSEMIGVLNSTYILAKDFNPCKINYTSSSAEYWSRYVLREHESTGVDNIAGVSLKNVLCLLFAWVINFFCLMKGVRSSGKVVYFTATFPYVILCVLLVRGLTLPGFMKGIEFYMIPKPEKLLDPKVWGDAATQIFYSLGPGFGGLLTMASYNNFHNNCYRDAVVVALVNCGTSVFAGFAVFSLLGFMADKTNQAVEDVASEGPGLAFIAYPEGLSQLPVAPLWSFLFFFMLLTLGLDSQFTMIETIISAFSDIFPNFLRKYKTAFTLFVCTVGFLLGIPLVTKGGIYVFQLMDWFSGSYQLIIVALVEVVVISWVYGIRNFMTDVEMMIGHKPNVYWLATWAVLTPLALLFIVIASAVKYTPASYNGEVFPPWAQGVGWLMVAVPLATIIVVAIIMAFRMGLKKAIRPQANWGPALPEDRTGRYAAVNAGFQWDDVQQNGMSSEKPQIVVGDVEKAPPYVISEGDYNSRL